MIKYYHVTPYQNIDSIMQNGIIPQIGPLSKKLREPHPAVFLFNDIISAEEAIMNWYGNEFSEDTKFAMIHINLPINQHTNLTYDGRVGYECQYHGIIDSRWITHIIIV